MKNNMSGVQQSFKKNSSGILAAVSIVGIIAVAVSSGFATKKAMQRVEKAEQAKERALTRAEIVKSAVPAYLPTAAIALSTIFCVVGAHALSAKQCVSLSSAYALVSSSYKEYREKLIELHGTEADEEVRDAIIRSSCAYHQIDPDVPAEKLIFVESLSGDFVTRYERDIIDAEYHLNRNFVIRGGASLNEFRSFLGLPPVDYGDKFGWTCAEGYCFVDFEHRKISRDDGGPDVYEILYEFEPVEDFYEI